MYELTLPIASPYGQLFVLFVYDLDFDGSPIVEHAWATVPGTDDEIDLADSYPLTVDDDLTQHALEIERDDAIDSGACTADEWHAAQRYYAETI